jgi:hypothetical protein
MNFFRLQVGSTFVKWGSGTRFAQIRCPDNPGHARSGDRMGKLSLDVTSSIITDFSDTPIEIVLTDRALSVLCNEGLTGFEPYPAEIRAVAPGIDLESLPRLWEVRVRGDGGRPHPDSGISVRYKCEACGLVRYTEPSRGLLVDPTHYDGSDIFTLTGFPGYKLVSRRFVETVLRHNLTNTSFLESLKIRPG